ncbi:hypothetical protein N7499_012612 [Penicillium canescens]|nr:hypothetical protein N7522_003138 [Penicillium canescens]KAJ6063932.1 hypothetical protein N7499_012612 [Penicillium canescens]KAJ6154572.1 hypothetical protein N7485_012941 [Penicillium canescens]
MEGAPAAFPPCLYRDSTRIHNPNVLYVDFDGDVIGKSVSDAYNFLKADSFPTVQQGSPQKYANVGSNGSSDLASALVNGDSAPTALTYIWNSVRYPAFAQSAIFSNLMTLVSATRSSYYANNASSAVASANLTNFAALQTFLDPIQASEVNIKSMPRGG